MATSAGGGGQQGHDDGPGVAGGLGVVLLLVLEGGARLLQPLHVLRQIKLMRKLGVPLEEIRRMQAGGTVCLPPGWAP